MTGRSLTAAMNTQIGLAQTGPRLFIEALFDSGALRLWTGLGDISMLGQTWTGSGRLLTISPIRETQDTIAAGLQFSLAIMPTSDQPDAVDAILNIALSENYQGRAVTVYHGEVDTSGSLVADSFTRFKGKLDVMQDIEFPGGAVITVTAENRLIDLVRPRRRTYTPEDQKLRDGTDTYLDGVAALQTREIELGF